MTTHYIYSDASFSKNEALAAIGFAIFKSTQEHENNPLSENRLQISLVFEKNNIRAELRALLEAFKRCPSREPLVVFTDCQSIVDLPSRRQKLEQDAFVSGKTHEPLANADLYKEFYVCFDRLKPKLIWVKGHSPKKNGRAIIQANFAFLDRAVRKKLRESI